VEYLIPVLIGLVAGTASGLFGIGGGIIIVPLLLWLLKLPHVSATATSLVALLLPVGALGVWHYHRSGHLSPTMIKVGLLISLGMFFGGLFGAKIGTWLPSQYLARGFSLLLIFVALRLWFR